MSIFVPWPPLLPSEGVSVLSIVVRDTSTLRVSPGRENQLYQEIGDILILILILILIFVQIYIPPGEGRGRRRLDSPPPLLPPRPVQRGRVERRRKNLFHHLGLEGRGEGEEQLLRRTLEEEGGEPLRVTKGEVGEEQGSQRSRKKDLARFLGVESTTLDRRKDDTLRSLGSTLDSCSYSSSQIYSTRDSEKSSGNTSSTHSEYYLSTKM